MKIETNKDFDCYDVAEMNGINRGITIDGKALDELLADERRKFAEEFKIRYKQAVEETFGRTIRRKPLIFRVLDKLVAEYEKEQKGDNK